MNCPAEEELIRFAVNESDAAERRVVEDHIDRCGRCRAGIASLVRNVTVSGESLLETTEVLTKGTRLGRYTVVEYLGEGSMSRVYACHDPELDRPVAIKVLRDDLPELVDARARVTAEARALARLSHPNVVHVYEVAEQDGRVYVALEFIRGVTLKTWLSQKERPWHQVLEVLRAAGTGLAAAHAAAIVHCDVKPTNILIGADGRVCVADFGLARAMSLRPDADASHVDELQTIVHKTGVMVGTPAYFAPETFAGEPPSAKSDQYGFAVTAYEALFGRRPHPANDLRSLRAQVEQGDITRPEHTDTPRWVFDVIRRGLEVDADARHASMDELVRRLTPIQNRRKHAAVAAGLGVLLVAVLGLAATLVIGRSEPGDVCGGGADEISQVWGDRQRDAIHKAFAKTKLPAASALAARVVELLDASARDWSAAHRTSCQQGTMLMTMPPRLRERSAICLARQRNQLGSLVAILESPPEPSVVQRAPEAALALDPASDCIDPAALASATDLPADPRERQRVAELSLRLDDAEALQDTAQFAPAIAKVRSVLEDIGDDGHPPIEVRARLTLGTLLGETADFAGEERELKLAIERAGQSGDAAGVAKGWVNLIGNALHRDAPKDIDTLRLAADAAVSALESAESSRLRAIIHAGVAQGHAARGALAEAVTEYEKALEISRMDRSPRGLQTLSGVQHNFGLVLRDSGAADRAAALFQEALTSCAGSVGETHPHYAKALYSLASVRAAKGENEVALPDFERALDIHRRVLGDLHPSTAHVHNGTGHALVALGRADEARAHFDQAIAILHDHRGSSSRVAAFAHKGIGDLHFEAGKLKEAYDSYAKAIAILEEARGPDHKDVGLVLRELAKVRIEQGLHLSEATAHLERALRIYQSSLGENHLLVAEPLNALGEVLNMTGKHAQAALHCQRAAEIIEKERGARDSNLAAPLLCLGSAQLAMGRLSQAVASLSRAKPVATIPELVDVVLADAMWKLGNDRKKAISLARAARESFLKMGAIADSERRAVEKWLHQRGHLRQ